MYFVYLKKQWNHERRAYQILLFNLIGFVVQIISCHDISRIVVISQTKILVQTIKVIPSQPFKDENLDNILNHS